LDGDLEGIFFRLDGTLTRLVYPSGLSGVEFNGRDRGYESTVVCH